MRRIEQAIRRGSLQSPVVEIDSQVPRKYYVASDAEEHSAS